MDNDQITFMQVCQSFNNPYNDALSSVPIQTVVLIEPCVKRWIWHVFIHQHMFWAFDTLAQKTNQIEMSNWSQSAHFRYERFFCTFIKGATPFKNFNRNFSAFRTTLIHCTKGSFPLTCSKIQFIVCKRLNTWIEWQQFYCALVFVKVLQGTLLVFQHPFDFSTICQSECIVWFKNISLVKVFQSSPWYFFNILLTSPWLFKVKALFGSITSALSRSSKAPWYSFNILLTSPRVPKVDALFGSKTWALLSSFEVPWYSFNILLTFRQVLEVNALFGSRTSTLSRSSKAP